MKRMLQKAVWGAVTTKVVGVMGGSPSAHVCAELPGISD